MSWTEFEMDKYLLWIIVALALMPGQVFRGDDLTVGLSGRQFKTGEYTHSVELLDKQYGTVVKTV